MKRSIQVVVVGVVVLLFACAISALAQQTAPGSPRPVAGPVQQGSPRIPVAGGTLYIPKSSLPQPVPAGHNFAAHTNIQVYVPNAFTPETAPPYSGYGYETPQSLACHYGFTSDGASYPNCNPNDSSLNTATVGSQSIAIVDAYDDPVAGPDLAWFSLQFGLPFALSKFQVVWANTGESSCPVNYGYGVPYDYSGGWEVEESLDIEWAHAMAPGAKIYLVEACSDYDYDLAQAVLVANNLVQCGNSELNQSTGVLGTCPSVTNKGEVSMSWGGGEYSSETSYDSYFLGTGSNIVYFAASGDGPGTLYPCTSPNVVCVGGTTNRRNASTGNWEQETAWVFGGGGTSYYESTPSYQSGIGNCTANGPYRCVPDVSSDADPYTGVWVYDTFGVDFITCSDCTWWIVGGTSVATPTWAGVVNNAETLSGSFASSTNAELTTLYNNRKVTADFTDITAGYCGNYMGLSTQTYYDLCTGIGVPYTYAGK